ncbi:MAG TPA: type II toxin-antitoxin system RelE/ParE family toxin [Anaerolineae bacterium]|nr:type II toxin-antitoxin system RelE/ParE family toxin [Anaerolineae bacterium]HQI83748.1 type II toxin-antitoxin system RelE/ParE family toxin [Anaerolineae bacterium]
MNDPRRWEVILARQPERILRRLPRGLLQRLDRLLAELAENPCPVGAKKLVGHLNLYRVRIGDWRVVYAIEDDRLVVLVIRIAPRGEAYRGL